MNLEGGNQDDPTVTRTALIPRLNLSETFGVFDSLVHLPHLVRVDHQYRTGWSSILALQFWAIRIPRVLVLGEVLRIINDGSDEFASSEVGLEVTPNFHFEMVEAFRNSFFCQIDDFLIRISEPAC